jgi:cation transport ATPase
MARTNPKRGSLTRIFQNGMRDFAIAVLGALTAIAINVLLNASSFTDWLYRMFMVLLIILAMALAINFALLRFSAQEEST